jgi:hypothetical protein
MQCDQHNLFQNLYFDPAISLPQFQGKKIFEYESDTIVFEYNKLGYRSKEFDDIQKEFILVAGCSHSEGHGLHARDVWCHQVASSMGLDLVNLAKGSSGADFASQNIFNWMQTGKIPKVAIIQWPNPFRFMQWKNHDMMFVVSGTPTEVYQSRLKSDEFGFWAQWVHHIIFADKICQISGVPVLHVCFEEKKFVEHVLDILERNHIELFVDEKLPGATWHFDSQAADNFHHSAACHSKWADRVLTLLENRLK